jgi:hypothetical protein
MGHWGGGIATRIRGDLQARAGGAKQTATPQTYMRIIDVPQSGHLGTFISYKTRYGQFRRPYVIPTDPKTPAQLRRRRHSGCAAARWRTLADIQRAAWNAAGPQLESQGGQGQSGQLTGYNFFVSINSNLADINEPGVDDPPVKPQFSDNPVRDLAITNTGDVIALKLRVLAVPTRHTLVLCTKPCSPGRSFPGRFTFLGLLPEPVEGFSDITELYKALYGVPPVSTRIFIRIVQQINGWKDTPSQTTAVVPMG